MNENDMEKIFLNDLHRHNSILEHLLSDAFLRVLNSGRYILGTEVSEFEKEFSTFVGSKYCIGLSSGTDSLELALRSLGIGYKSKVAIVANAGSYSSTAVYACGAIPQYIDVYNDKMTMDPQDLRMKINKETKAVIVTHLYGQMANMPAILEITNKFEIPVIEDCAQAHGAELNKIKAGNWGKMGCFSFYPTKNLGALGDAGCIVTNDFSIQEHLLKLRQYGWSKKYKSDVLGGRNSRLDELQAAFLRGKLPYLTEWNNRRKDIANIYSQRLTKLKNKVICPMNFNQDNVFHLYVMRTNNRDDLAKYLISCGIIVDVHYPIPDHQQTFHKDSFLEVELPVTEKLCKEILSIPCYPELSNDEMNFIISKIVDYFV